MKIERDVGNRDDIDGSISFGGFHDVLRDRRRERSIVIFVVGWIIVCPSGKKGEKNSRSCQWSREICDSAVERFVMLEILCLVVGEGEGGEVCGGWGRVCGIDYIV